MLIDQPNMLIEMPDKQMENSTQLNELRYWLLEKHVSYFGALGIDSTRSILFSLIDI
jgi:hypothetical protein